MKQDSPPPRNPELLSRLSSRLLVVDMQEKLLPHIHESLAVVECCRQLIVGAQTLGVPVWATEQYPKGLKRTVNDLAPLLPEAIEKIEFSAMPVLKWSRDEGPDADRWQVVVCGVESHVCVLQTVFDLMANGYRVYVVADAVGSRNSHDREIALDRMSTGGATICTTESVLFEWCETAGAKEFKTISQLVTGRG